MDLKELKTWIKDIQVRNMKKADVAVINNSPLEMIGKGRQGAVFKVNDDICVKVFGNPEDCEHEYYALSLGQKSNLFPRIYAKDSSYIAMELIKGVDFREYLRTQALTHELSAKLVAMLITFKEIGFKRIDHHKRQIFLQADGNLKVIDVARSANSGWVYPYPRKLLSSIGGENREIFLSHVQAIAPKLYDEWMHYIRMEELSRNIYQILINQSNDTDTLKTLSEKLLTIRDKETYIHQLESLFHKVFEEEWIKTMLARGYDPMVEMDKIKECIKSLERESEKDRNVDPGKERDVYRRHKHKKHHKKPKHRH